MKPNKPKKRVSVEDKMAKFHNDTWYSLTINPDDHYQHGKGYRPTVVRNNVITFLRKYLPYLQQVELEIDISYPPALRAGTYPRIHYHGWVCFKDVVGFLINYDPHEHYSVEIDTVDDEEYWAEYVDKFVTIHENMKMYKINTHTLEEMDRKMKEPRDKMNIVQLCMAHRQKPEDVFSNDDSDDD